MPKKVYHAKNRIICVELRTDTEKVLYQMQFPNYVGCFVVTYPTPVCSHVLPTHVGVFPTFDSYKIEYTNFQESKDNAIGFLCDDLWKTFRELGIDFHGDLYQRFYMNYYGKDVFIGDNYWSILDHTTNRTYQGIFFTYDDTNDLGTTPAINEYVFSEIRDGDIYFKEKESDKDFVIDTTKSKGSSGWCKFRQ